MDFFNFAIKFFALLGVLTASAFLLMWAFKLKMFPSLPRFSQEVSKPLQAEARSLPKEGELKWLNTLDEILNANLPADIWERSCAFHKRDKDNALAEQWRQCIDENGVTIKDNVKVLTQQEMKLIPGIFLNVHDFEVGKSLQWRNWYPDEPNVTNTSIYYRTLGFSDAEMDFIVEMSKKFFLDAGGLCKPLCIMTVEMCDTGGPEVWPRLVVTGVEWKAVRVMPMELATYAVTHLRLEHKAMNFKEAVVLPPFYWNNRFQVLIEGQKLLMLISDYSPTLSLEWTDRGNAYKGVSYQTVAHGVMTAIEDSARSHSGRKTTSIEDRSQLIHGHRSYYLGVGKALQLNDDRKVMWIYTLPKPGV